MWKLTIDGPLGLFTGSIHRQQGGVRQQVGGVAVNNHCVAIFVSCVSTPVALLAVCDPPGFVAGPVQDSRFRGQHHETPASALQPSQKLSAGSPVNQR